MVILRFKHLSNQGPHIVSADGSGEALVVNSQNKTRTVGPGFQPLGSETEAWR